MQIQSLQREISTSSGEKLNFMALRELGKVNQISAHASVILILTWPLILLATLTGIWDVVVNIQ